MECAKKIVPDCSDEFYPNDKTCKECRKALVRQNRAKNIEYYREYDRKRFKEDPKVRARHRRYQATPAGKESVRKSQAKWSASISGRRSREKWIDENPIKKGASTMVGNAVRDGKLIKPSECSECGSGGIIHGHHNDYAYPLVVRWLCAKCHTAWHQENGEGLNG